MTTRTYGILAGVIGSALGCLWYSRRRALNAPTTPARDRGVTIFHNTPAPTPLSEEGVI